MRLTSTLAVTVILLLLLLPPPSLRRDRWLARPASIWRVHVHFLERVELSCVAGQRTLQSLVLRGSQAPRKVRCYCSHPRQLEVRPTLGDAHAFMDTRMHAHP